ncbi:hypothetical protein EXS73_01955 [Candidatus Pacearchaeota archaeon]|nr:hypothetical protein [Candidatus Pacearchaeota archaeon]
MKTIVPFLILTCLLLAPLVSSAELPFQDTVEQTQDVVNKLNDQQARDTYLKEQWADFLNKSTAGKYIREADRQLTSLNFVWQFLLGIPFSWNFLFLFSAIIWISLGTSIKRLLAFLELWDTKVHWAVGFGVATLASALGVERTLATWGVGLTQGFNIPGINPFIVQLVLELALILGVLYIGIFTKVWERLFEIIKAKMERKQEKKDIKTLKEEVSGIKLKNLNNPDYTKYDIT